MKLIIRPYRLSGNILALLFGCAFSVGLAFGSLFLAKIIEVSDGEYRTISTDVRQCDEQKLTLAPADFSLRHMQGRPENFEPPCCSTLQSIKIIRSSIFDEAQQTVLTRRLAWFSRSIYLRNLSAIWHPSIPIAHRKLII